jgi:hypothetical protein
MSAVDASPSTQLVILCHIMGGCYIKESQSTLHPTQRREYENLEKKKNENIPINTENNNAASDIMRFNIPTVTVGYPILCQNSLKCSLELWYFSL